MFKLAQFSLISQLYELLNASEIKRLGMIFSVIVLIAVLELVSIASLMPYLKILSDHNLVFQSSSLNAVYEFFHFTSMQHYLIFLGCIIFLLMLLKGMLSLVNIYIKARLAEVIRNRLSEVTLTNFLNKPYYETIEVNSATFSKHIIIEVTNTVSLITQSLSLLADSLVLIALVSLMVWVNPKLVFGMAAIILLATVFISKLTKSRLQALGKEIELANRDLYQRSSEALAGRKDISVYNAQNFFTQKFITSLSRITNELVVFDSISGMPGIILNTVAFGLLLIALLYLLMTNSNNLMNVIPIIAVIGMSIQRLLPVSTRMYNALALILRFAPGVKIVLDILSDEAAQESVRTATMSGAEKLAFNQSMQLDKVSFYYESPEQLALQDINFTIHKNHSVGIVGASGAGKSTMVDMILGLLKPQMGNILVDGKPVRDVRQLRRITGYVPQTTFLLDASVRENIVFGYDDIDDARMANALEIAQLKDFVGSLEHGLETRICEGGIKFSGGQRQRLGIARALYRDPDIIIMDEATNALDSQTEADFNQALARLSGEKTLIIIAHRLSSVIQCDKIITLQDGKIVGVGNYNELIEDNLPFQQLYHEQMAW